MMIMTLRSICRKEWIMEYEHRDSNTMELHELKSFFPKILATIRHFT